MPYTVLYIFHVLCLQIKIITYIRSKLLCPAEDCGKDNTRFISSQREPDIMEKVSSSYCTYTIFFSIPDVLTNCRNHFWQFALWHKGSIAPRYVVCPWICSQPLLTILTIVEWKVSFKKNLGSSSGNTCLCYMNMHLMFNFLLVYSF